MEIMYWLVTAVVLDGLVMATNIIELTLLLRKWKNLDRIEHILFSLCVADLTCGVVMFGQDTYQLKLVVMDTMHDMTTTVANVLDCFIVFFILVSHFHVTAIALERIVAVSKPLKYSVFTTYKCKVFTISFVWSLALVLSPMLVILTNFYLEVGQNLLASSIMVACVIVFLSYMLLTYLLIQRERNMKDMLEPEIRRQIRDRRTTIFCLLFGFSFLVCMLPYALGLFSYKLWHEFEIILLTAYHLVNPLVYFVKYYFNRRTRRRTRTANSASNLATRSPLTTRSTFIAHQNGRGSFRA